MEFILRSIIKRDFTNLVDDIHDDPRISDFQIFPRDYIAYTLYDPILELIYSYDSEIRNEAKQNPGIKQQAKELFEYQDYLLKPLYEDPHSTDKYGYKYNCNPLSFLIHRTTFQILEPGNFHSRYFDVLDNRTISETLHFLIELKKAHTRIGVNFNEWIQWLKTTYDIEIQNFSLAYCGKKVTVSCCIPNCKEDHIAGLLTLLHDDRHKIGIKSCYWSSQ